MGGGQDLGQHFNGNEEEISCNGRDVAVPEKSTNLK
jgi:hypothetical protein